VGLHKLLEVGGSVCELYDLLGREVKELVAILNVLLVCFVLFILYSL
jgi:hypothetical protein